MSAACGRDVRKVLQQLLAKHRGGFLIVLLAVAVSVRVVFVASRENAVYFPDSEIYDAIARGLCSGKGFVQDEFRQISRPPAYPLFLGACYSVFGHSFLAVRLLQAVVGAVTCVMIVLLGEYLLHPASGRIAGAVAALYPFFVFFCGLVLTETLFTFFLVLAVWLLAKAQRGSAWWAAGSGATLGAATLLRSSLFLFWGFLLPFWLLGLGGERRRAVRSLLAGLLGTAVVMAPWVIRNYRITGGRFVPTTLMVGRSLYEANSPDATGGPAMHRIDWEAVKGGAVLTEMEDNDFFRGKALAYMKEHPGRTLRLAGAKLLRFWNVVPNCSAYRGGKYVAISVLTYGPVLLLGIVGVVRWRGRPARAALLCVPVLYFCLLHMVFVGSIRYRTPVMPFVILFAAEGIRSALWPLDGNEETTEEAGEAEEEA